MTPSAAAAPSTPQRSRRRRLAFFCVRLVGTFLCILIAYSFGFVSAEQSAYMRTTDVLKQLARANAPSVVITETCRILTAPSGSSAEALALGMTFGLIKRDWPCQDLRLAAVGAQL